MAKNGRIQKRILTVIESVLILIFFFSLSYILLNLYLDNKSEKTLSDMRNVVKASRLQQEEIKIPEAAIAKNEEKKAKVEAELAKKEAEKKAEAEAMTTKKTNVILDVYKEFHDKNENFNGWLYVEDTELEYPVMKGPDNKFYLSHDIERKYDKHGMLIMDDGCDETASCPHLIIYGHNVNSGKMFGDLLFYKDASYYKYHPDISFDTLYERGSYRVFAVLATTVNEAQKEIELFTTYSFNNKKDYEKIVKWAKEHSLYKIDYVPEYGDGILSLVTCEHSQDEGRFVVMAARVK